MNEPRKILPKWVWWLGVTIFIMWAASASYKISKHNTPPARAVAQPQVAKPHAVATVSITKPMPTPPAEDMKPLEDAKVVMAGITPKQCTPQVAETCLSLLNRLASTLWDFRHKSLTPEQQKLVEAFRSSLVKTQQATLPTLRKSYGKVLGQKLWEYDVSVNVTGEKNRTLELVGAAFAANRNMKQMTDMMMPIAVRLQFTRIQYRWHKGGDVTWFNLKGSDTADDSRIISWRDDNGFLEVE